MLRIVVLFFLFVTLVGHAKTIYIAKNGKNTNNGSKKAPFLTIQHAVNQLKAGDRCFIRGGTYREVIQFHTSGSLTHPILLSAYPNEKVIITPTFHKKKWVYHSKHIVKTKIRHKVLQVFENGKPSMQACYPNIIEGELSTKPWANLFTTSSKIASIKGLEKFGPLTGCHLVGICGRGLVALNGEMTPISGNKYAIKNNAFYWKKEHFKAYLGKGKGFVTGNLALLDAPGEWFHDGEYLYYYAKQKSISPSKLEIRTNEFALVIRNQQYIHIRNISVFGGNVKIDSSSHCELNGMNISYPTPFFTFKSGFDRFGGILDGIDFNNPINWSGKGVQISGLNNVLMNSIIEHSWGDGLTVWGSNHQIKNCYVNDCDWIGIDCAPLNITGNNHRVAYCTFSKAARSILVHRKLTHSKILHNEISEGGILNDDLGLTYTYDTDGKGTEIAYNWIHDNFAPHFGGGIYLDNNHKNFVVHHNVVWNCFVAMVVNQRAENDRIYNNSFIHNKYSMGACRPDGGALDFTNIFTFNNLTDSELKARDHNVFYGTKQVNNQFVPHLSNLMVNPSEKRFELRDGPSSGSGTGMFNSGYGKNTLTRSGVNVVGARVHLKKETSTFNVDWVLFACYLILFCLLIKRVAFLRFSSLSFWKNIGLFIVKILGAFSLFWVYTSYYPNRETADIFKCFDDAKIIYNHVYSESAVDYFKFLFGLQVDSPAMNEALIHTKYWLRQTELGTIGDNHVLIKIHAFIHLFSHAYYPIHLLFFAFISYLGSLLFYKFIIKFSLPSKFLLISLFFTPSVLFFCSGTLKETIILFLMIVLFFATYLIVERKKWLYILPLLLSGYLLLILKVYVLLALFPGLICFGLFTAWKTKFWFWFSLIIFVGYIFVLFTLPSIDFISNLQFKQHDLMLVAREMHAGSTIKILPLDGTIMQLISTIPSAFYNVYLRPSLFDAHSWTETIAALENYCFLVLIILSIMHFRHTSKQQRVFLFMIFSFGILLTLFIGWTVPIVGAIVRYKVFIVAIILPSIRLQSVRNLDNTNSDI